MPRVDNPDTTGKWLLITYKQIAIDDAVIPMPGHKASFRFKEDIVSEFIVIGLAGNDLYLTIASIKEIIRNIHM